MTRTLAVMLAVVLVALAWQSWRLNNARHAIDTQGEQLATSARHWRRKTAS